MHEDDTCLLYPVFLIKRQDSDDELMIAHELVDGNFGLLSVTVNQNAPSTFKPHRKVWRYELKTVDHEPIVEVMPSISFFKGQVVTPPRWRPPVYICSEDQVDLITDWIKSMNNQPLRR